MKKFSRSSCWFAVVVSVGYLAFACTNGAADEPEGDGNSKGGSSAAGTGGNKTGGSVGVAGNSANTGGGTSTGGAATGGGSNATGGTSSAGSSGNGGTAGADGSGGSAGASNGGRRPVQKSAGCGKTTYSKEENQTISTKGGEGQYIVSLPASYDPSKAYPLGFGFHGYGRTHEQCQNGDCLGFQSVMQNEAILIYMKSFTAGWENSGTTRDNNAAFFVDVMAKMKSDYCVDENRVFVAGTSSGAAFAAVLACRYGDQLIASVPVAGSMPEKNCAGGPTPMLVIHGIADRENNISGGRDVRDFYIEKNGCDNSSVPPVAEVDKRVLDDRDDRKEGYECADYQNCSAGFPVRWCVHSEATYEDTNHGWPSFGGKEIWDFVKAL